MHKPQRRSLKGVSAGCKHTTASYFSSCTQNFWGESGLIIINCSSFLCSFKLPPPDFHAKNLKILKTASCWDLKQPLLPGTSEVLFFFFPVAPVTVSSVAMAHAYCWPLISVKPLASTSHQPACQSCLFSTTGTTQQLTRRRLFEVHPTTSTGLKHDFTRTSEHPAATF